LNIEIVNPLNFENWDNIILTNPDYSFFHTTHWAKVISETYKYKPEYLLFGNISNIISIIPMMTIHSIINVKRGVSLPFSDFCEPLVFNKVNFDEIIKELILYYKNNGWKFFEIRGGKLFEQNNYYKNYYLHNLNLNEDSGKIFSNFRESTKRNIKTGYKNDLKVSINYSQESMDIFYHLNCLTRKRHGLPPQPREFFNNIYKHIILKKIGFIVLASYNNNYIAGSVYFHFGDKAIYKYGASIPEYNFLKANNLIMWEAIQWYCVNKFRVLSFGRTDIGDQGLLQYKDGWGTEKSILRYIKYDLKKESFVKDSVGSSLFINKIFNKMPLPVLKLIGEYIYKYFG
jgi:hypothetical protein